MVLIALFSLLVFVLGRFELIGGSATGCAIRQVLWCRIPSKFCSCSFIFPLPPSRADFSASLQSLSAFVVVFEASALLSISSPRLLCFVLHLLYIFLLTHFFFVQGLSPAYLGCAAWSHLFSYLVCVVMRAARTRHVQHGIRRPHTYICVINAKTLGYDYEHRSCQKARCFPCGKVFRVDPKRGYKCDWYELWLAFTPCACQMHNFPSLVSSPRMDPPIRRFVVDFAICALLVLPVREG